MNPQQIMKNGDTFRCPEGCPAFTTTRKPANCPHCGKSLEGEVYIVE